MNKSEENQKNQKNEDIIDLKCVLRDLKYILRDLKYVLNVNHKGHLWWKKPIYKTHIADIIVINDDHKPVIMESMYKGDNKLKEELLNCIDNKLESMGIFVRDIMPDVYTMSINSNWEDEELDKALNYFITTIIRYK